MVIRHDAAFFRPNKATPQPSPKTSPNPNPNPNPNTNTNPNPNPNPNPKPNFRAHQEACASFARYVREAEAAGVSVMARRVRWGEGEDLGKAFDAGAVPVRLE